MAERNERGDPVRRSSGPIVLAFLSLLYLVGEFVSLAHFAAERHAWCAQHGRLEHGSAAHACVSHLDREDTPHADVVLQPCEPDEEHAACEYVDQGLPKSAPGLPRLAPVEFAAPSIVSSLPEGRLVVEGARYRLAPKQSPPARSVLG
ncbi:MAG: hypothetical protein IPJ77_00025 [Planctomycetes bacterium]|nr:hypothetical protein [Planctomycetota bacterium]